MGSLFVSNAIPMTQLSVAAASITPSYTVVGTFSAPLVYGFIVSTLDQPVQLSFDGVNDHIAVPAGNTVPVCIPLNFKDNLTILPKPSVSVKEIGNPTTGNLYICGFSSSVL